MDRSLQPAANVVLNRYFAETRRAEDLDALATLPFLMFMRAASLTVQADRVTALGLSRLFHDRAI
jgi:aminoglycoside phosphotransferase family enzyme